MRFLAIHNVLGYALGQCHDGEHGWQTNRLGLPCVGLLVDKDNPVGEALYASVGFHYVNDSQWGGHPMKYLVYRKRY